MFDHAKRPSELIAACLNGEIMHDDLPPACQSAIRLQYYRHAVEILSMTVAQAQQRKIAQFPETCRAQIKAECRRLFNYRSSVNGSNRT